jgi:hypothetical protein
VILTTFATDAAEFADDLGNWAIGRNFALNPGERLAVAANAGSEAPVVPSPIAAATAAIPAALVKKFLGFVDSLAAIFLPFRRDIAAAPELHSPPHESVEIDILAVALRNRRDAKTSYLQPSLG